MGSMRNGDFPRGRKIAKRRNAMRRVRLDGEIIENRLSHRRTKEIFPRPTNSLAKWAHVWKKKIAPGRLRLRERENARVKERKKDKERENKKHSSTYESIRA